MKLFLLLIGFSVSFFSFGQTQGKIVATIHNDHNAALENVTVELLKAKDSSLFRTAISNTSGKVTFDKVPFGSYLIKATIVNYNKNFSTSFVLAEERNNVELPVISLQPVSASLGEVKVSAKKPFIQKLIDRIVVNVDNSIVSSGSTAMDVLERSPGVTVGQNDAISMAGKAGVVIMINGKIVPMTGEELGNYLRSLPSSVIERIDLIANPSAKYDAAGNAGIIDIRMKKDQRLGFNGTLTANYGQGYYPKTGAGNTFNYRSKKVNLFGNFNYNYSNNFNNLITRRDFFTNGIHQGAYDQDNMIRRYVNSTSARVGADYFMGKKTIIGFIASGNTYLTRRTGDNNSQVLDISDQKVSSFLTDVDGKENFNSYAVNFNFKHSFDSTGKELTADADIAGYYRDWASDFLTGYYDANDNLSQPLYLANSDQEGFTGIKTLKVDYVNPLKKGRKWEAGFKTSFVNADNDVLFYDRSSGIPDLDSSKSNSFEYEENINAAYLNYNTDIKKFSFQFGLRAENTHTKTFQVFDKISTDTSYLQIFPSFFVNYKLKESQTIGASMSRRIDRPGYGQLNPFKIFVDPSFFASGVPSLKPALTWSYQLSYTRKQMNIALAYSRTNNYITTVLIPSETESRVTIQTTVNLTSFDYFGVTLNTPLRINKWWNMINNVNLYYGQFKGYVAQTVVNGKRMNAQVSSNSSFSFKKAWSAELNFSYFSGQNTGVMKDKPYWGLSTGVQKLIWKNKATVRFNVTDILWRQWPRFSGNYTNYREVTMAKRDTRVATLSFTWRFGSNTVAQARRRTTGSEEERRRAQ
jgi:iron complex outermembrane receptor protein